MSTATEKVPHLRFVAYGRHARKMYRMLRDEGFTPHVANLTTWGAIAARGGRAGIIVDGSGPWYMAPEPKAQP